MSTTTRRTAPDPAARYAQPQLQRREFTTRATALEGAREVTGLAVPWDQEAEIFPGFFERWAPGAAEAPEDGTKLFWLHTHPIGRVVSDDRDHAEGWAITARVSRTPTGDEALTLTEDGVITRMSVGFRALEWETTEDEDGVHVTITRALVPEVSLVPFPAYQGATVTGTRHQLHPDDPARTTNPTTQGDTAMADAAATTLEHATRADLEPLTEGLDEVRQRLAMLPDHLGTQADPHPADAFRSVGQYAQALVRGDEAAQDLFTRAVTTDDTITTTGSGWVGNMARIINRRRRILSLFGHTYDLPATGMTVEHGVLLENTVQVQEQVNQGDALVYGQVRLGQENAPVKTFGGYSEVPRQVIERSSIGYLDFLFEAQAAAYGRAMELYARAVLDAAVTAQRTADEVVTADAALGAMTDLSWLKVILDADEAMDEAGHAVAGLLVGKDVLLAMASIEHTNRMLKWTPAPDGHSGTLEVQRGGPTGEVLGIEVQTNPAWKSTPGQAVFFDPIALKTREAPGAPFRLQDENIVNLTKAFSVYGYAASWAQVPDALVPVTFGA